ncbi:NUDIX domain-containing protein [Alicyclobacillus mali]|uniref:NUDIX domain-containing protein n=1 Tax=Alicyclobacillus mali (ex Roth et al. 2021) TaxID=1123961 RepID=A0ABS0F172_9BACL|nr:NUDIX domain-containing protein [Alicyclobacillus mali (ex Roth et al. 2021)]MBF8377032.1 NUDIX domain-containing protein [Alicyclobacillus mali (ex Roth et al. 2021)]MCL6489757.1 NUDIX domain-containing protein [Alicyclobacillus mali (ex Roth et al. 2021)]
MTEIRKAATLVVIRDGASGDIEVLAIRRAMTMRFLPGFVAFPGGAVDPSDASVAKRALGRPVCAEDDDDPGFAVTALRETAEEIGWLLAVQDGAGTRQDIPLSPEEQAELCKGAASLSAWLSTRGLAFDLGCLRRIGRFVTPPTQPVRFDTRFFLCVGHELGEPRIHGAELDAARWASARDMLARIESGELPAVRPTIAVLKALAECQNAEMAMSSLNIGPLPPPAPRA